ncbi:MAG: hypothetical protein IPL27_16510 [Lewinellaceae bacterium]|nr:hypothetical protein [Lewinellaceae bacterium]
MQHSFLFQVFQGVAPEEFARLRKFLQSPAHNRRSDVVRLFDWLVVQRQQISPVWDKKSAFFAVYPTEPYDADQFNLSMRYLLDLIEHFLAYEEWRSDERQYRLSLMRALRRRELGAHFERNAQRLVQQQRARTERHAGYHLLEYQLQSEIFEYRVVSQRNWQDNLPAVVDALGQFFVLENLRWSGMIAALRLRSDAELPEAPLAEAVRRYAEQPERPESLVLQYYSARIMAEPDNEAAFSALCDLLPHSTELFPPSQSRDLYMTAINFCIRRQNKGERDYTHRALNLYRQALEKGILQENGILPKYTYHNINALAHLAGEGAWAEQFLETARELLAPAVRDNAYHYNLAICFFRKGDYSRTLDLLRSVESNEIFVQIDIRRMLLRVYFELGEWLALDSLLTSFKAFLQRQKNLGYHREIYLNLIKFTKKLLQHHQSNQAKRNALILKIKQTPQIAERDWLLEKLL